MMIVDTPGFQNPEQGGSARGASFEELCHNYAQDRLQRLFHECTFVQELERYKEVTLDLASAGHPPPGPAPPSASWHPQGGQGEEGRSHFPHFCSLSFPSPCAPRSGSLVLPQTASFLCREFALQEVADVLGALRTPPCPPSRHPSRPCELPPHSSYVHVGPAGPSLSPDLLRR